MVAALFSRAFTRTCQVGCAGALFFAWKYRSDYSSLPTDATSTARAFSMYSADRNRQVYDVAIVGGGIVGVATAREVRARYPQKRVILLEREADVAQHQSGHNSGCLHAGVLYPPGTPMARLCPKGNALMVAYCRKHKLPCELCGKLLVATNEEEMKNVEKFYAYGIANNVAGLKILRGREAIQAKEPLVTGVGALYSAHSGIVDFAEVTRHMLQALYKSASGNNRFSAKFQYEAQDFVGVRVLSPGKLEEELVLVRGREHNHLGPEKVILAQHVITCCGLGNDQVAHGAGHVTERIGNRIRQTYGFRGRYYQLVPERRDMVHMHVYPCLDDDFVRVHFTPTVDVRRGHQVIIGPGCTFAADRYGYTPYAFDPQYLLQCANSCIGLTSLFSSLNAFVDSYFKDVSKKAFLYEAQRLIPSLQMDDMQDSFCGVLSVGGTIGGTLSNELAMELARPRTTMETAFTKGLVIQPVREIATTGAEDPPLILNVRNAPSPAATASMAIAMDIVDTAVQRFQWDRQRGSISDRML